jgi:hypothetical protein
VCTHPLDADMSTQSWRDTCPGRVCWRCMYSPGRVERLEVKQTWLDEVECVDIIDARTLACNMSKVLALALAPRVLHAGRLAGWPASAGLEEQKGGLPNVKDRAILPKRREHAAERLRGISTCETSRVVVVRCQLLTRRQHGIIPMLLLMSEPSSKSTFPSQDNLAFALLRVEGDHQMIDGGKDTWCVWSSQSARNEA